MRAWPGNDSLPTSLVMCNMHFCATYRVLPNNAAFPQLGFTAMGSQAGLQQSTQRTPCPKAGMCTSAHLYTALLVALVAMGLTKALLTNQRELNV